MDRFTVGGEQREQPARKGPVRRGGVVSTRVGLQIHVGLAFDEWERTGAQLARIMESSSWCLGDWLIYGEKMYPERYRLAIESAALDYQTLRNYAWIARRFPLSRRRASLSVQHHAEVASMTDAEQDQWLDRAEQCRWSRNELRRRLRDSRGSVAVRRQAVALPQLRVSVDHVRRWRDAAELSSTQLEEWMVDTLNGAAARVLREAAPERSA